MNPDQKTILYVDDDADDRELLRHAMQKIAPELTIAFSENGVLALELLNERKKTASLPCLIVLDLNMPFLTGRQTFERIQADPLLKHIPVVVLTSGENPLDKSLFSRDGIPYFTKPIEPIALEVIAHDMIGLCG